MRIKAGKKEIRSEKKNKEKREFINIFNRVIVMMYVCERDPNRMREKSTSLLVASENLGHSVRSRKMKALL
jgi:hypothetical protein